MISVVNSETKSIKRETYPSEKEVNGSNGGYNMSCVNQLALSFIVIKKWRLHLVESDRKKEKVKYIDIKYLKHTYSHIQYILLCSLCLMAQNTCTWINTWKKVLTQNYSLMLSNKPTLWEIKLYNPAKNIWFLKHNVITSFFWLSRNVFITEIYRMFGEPKLTYP